MGLDKKAMFEKLLEQIKWQDDREAFSDALIARRDCILRREIL